MRAIVVAGVLCAAVPAHAERWVSLVATQCGPRDEGTPLFGVGLGTGWRDTFDLVTHFHETENLVFGLRWRFGLARDLMVAETQFAYTLGHGKMLLANEWIVRFELLAFAGGGLSTLDDGGDYPFGPVGFAGGTLRVRLPYRFALDLDVRRSYVPDTVEREFAARVTTPAELVEYRFATEVFAAFTYQAHR
jgi:hypothetical protein